MWLVVTISSVNAGILLTVLAWNASSTKLEQVFASHQSRSTAWCLLPSWCLYCLDLYVSCTTPLFLPYKHGLSLLAFFFPHFPQAFFFSSFFLLLLFFSAFLSLCFSFGTSSPFCRAHYPFSTCQKPNFFFCFFFPLKVPLLSSSFVFFFRFTNIHIFNILYNSITSLWSWYTITRNMEAYSRDFFFLCLSYPKFVLLSSPLFFFRTLIVTVIVTTATIVVIGSIDPTIVTIAFKLG